MPYNRFLLMNWLKTTLCLLVGSLVISCKDNSVPSRQNKMPTAGSGSTAEKNYADAKYVAKVYGSLVTEIEINRIAIRRSVDPVVTQLAAGLLKSYEALGKKIEGIAAAKHLSLEPKLRFDQENHIEFLQKEPETTFDREYIDILTREHKKFMEDFQLTGTNSYDPETSALSAEVLKIIAANYACIMTARTEMKSRL